MLMLRHYPFSQWLIVTAMLLTLGVVTPALADELSDCDQTADPDLSIRACTNLIERGSLKGDALAAAHFNRGTAYIIRGDRGRAIAEYDKAIDIKPDFAFAYINRGNAYADKGQLKRAIADYDRAIKVKPDFAFAYSNRSIAYREKGNTERAAADCKKAREIDKDARC